MYNPATHFNFFFFSFAEDPNAETYTYGITSLVDKKDFLQKGDNVKFQIAITKSSGKRRATNIEVVRNIIEATVDLVKGQVRRVDLQLFLNTVVPPSLE